MINKSDCVLAALRVCLERRINHHLGAGSTSADAGLRELLWVINTLDEIQKETYKADNELTEAE
jgi:hypothetical protein